MNFFIVSGSSLGWLSNYFLSPNRERMNLKAPIYFSTGLTEKANHYYKLFITWTNQKIRKTFVQRNMFEFKHIKAFDRSYADNPGPMVSILYYKLYTNVHVFNLGWTFKWQWQYVYFQVVFATPGMLHAGQSLQIFKKWAGNEKNMVSPVRKWNKLFLITVLDDEQLVLLFFR